MHNAEDADLDADRGGRISAYSTLDKAELEVQAIAAIRELRLLVGTAQLLYEEWLQAEDDPASSATLMSAMQEDYLKRQRDLAQRQNRLDEMLEALGFVPEVRDAS